MTETRADITYHEKKVERPGGIGIFLRSWRPNGHARGGVVIVPGFNAHGGQYAWVAGQFVAGGLAVYSLDLRATSEAPAGMHSSMTLKPDSLTRCQPSQPVPQA
jgi:acylglycerol lipase